MAPRKFFCAGPLTSEEFCESRYYGLDELSLVGVASLLKRGKVPRLEERHESSFRILEWTTYVEAGPFRGISRTLQQCENDDFERGDRERRKYLCELLHSENRNTTKGTR